MYISEKLTIYSFATESEKLMNKNWCVFHANGTIILLQTYSTIIFHYVSSTESKNMRKTVVKKRRFCFSFVDLTNNTVFAAVRWSHQGFNTKKQDKTRSSATAKKQGVSYAFCCSLVSGYFLSPIAVIIETYVWWTGWFIIIIIIIIIITHTANKIRLRQRAREYSAFTDRRGFLMMSLLRCIDEVGLREASTINSIMYAVKTLY